MVFAIASVNCNSASPVLCVLCSACLPQSKMPAGAMLSGFMLVRLPVAAEDAKKRACSLPCHARLASQPTNQAIEQTLFRLTTNKLSEWYVRPPWFAVFHNNPLTKRVDLFMQCMKV